jgi:TolA-binding protein
MHTSGKLYETKEKPQSAPQQNLNPQNAEPEEEGKTISFMVDEDLNKEEFNTQTAGTNAGPPLPNDIPKTGTYGREGWDTKRKVKVLVLSVILVLLAGYMVYDNLALITGSNPNQQAVQPYNNQMPPADEGEQPPTQINTAQDAGPQPNTTGHQPPSGPKKDAPVKKAKKNADYLQGHKLLKSKKYREAIDSFKKAIKGKAAKYTKLLAYYHIAKTFEKKMNNPKMALAYWKVLKKKPSHEVPKQTNLPKKAIKEVLRLEKVLKDPKYKSKKRKTRKRSATKPIKKITKKPKTK